MKFLVFALLPVFALGGQSPRAPSEAGIPDPSHQPPVPGTSIVRFKEVDEGVYKGSKPKSDADFRFLQSKRIKYILEVKFLPLLDGPEKRKAKKHGIVVIPALMNASPVLHQRSMSIVSC